MAWSPEKVKRTPNLTQSTLDSCVANRRSITPAGAHPSSRIFKRSESFPFTAPMSRLVSCHLSYRWRSWDVS
ncbi:MAG: hypothetical protein ACPH8R_05675, partial [Luminiphilus sp.]